MFDHKATNKHIFQHDPQQLISICFLTVALFPHRFGEENIVNIEKLYGSSMFLQFPVIDPSINALSE